ncbi:class I SAM-dependent methyltransferase [Methanosarcina sp. UBA411]|uniref:class I SAM-dependent methyltransferase n=1 Tax=Methanosarcina sp. UBA411 TaxID=1915589 RepID=UPI0025D3B599|nr:methyltransferase domain-containing protein [Methanosarcina sp. UBA411]
MALNRYQIFNISKKVSNTLTLEIEGVPKPTENGCRLKPSKSLTVKIRKNLFKRRVVKGLYIIIAWGIFIDCKKVIASYWNIRSSTYTNGINGFDEEERAVWKQIFENSFSLSERLNILDVGTGAGFLALLFAEMGHKVTGIDLSTNMLKKAKHNADNMGLKIDFFHGDAENLPFEDSSFDLVTNKFLLWTLQKPSCAVTEWKRVLKPGGMVFAIDGDWFDPRPGRRVNRMISEWADKFLKKNQHNSVFKDYYGPIRSSLPLYEKISPENASLLFSETGLVNTSVNSLLEVQEFKKSRQSFLQRVLGNNSIFLASGQKTLE